MADSTLRLALRRAAVAYLARREYTVQELRRKLLAKAEVTPTLVNEIIDSLITERLVSDERFTEAYIRMRSQRGYGPVRIREELKERGIVTALIDAYLDEAQPLWRDLLASVWQKRFNGRYPTDFAEQARQMRFLHYRGFDAGQIKAFFETKAAL